MMIEAIETRVELDAEPGRVWRALTVSAELARWFPVGGAFDLGAKGEGASTWREHGAFAVRVREK